MRQAAKHLIGRHDFKSFQAHDPLREQRQTVRTIKRIAIKKDDELITIDITADGFLYKMVRNITGTLLTVGAGRLQPDEILRILKARGRQKSPKYSSG